MASPSTQTYSLEIGEIHLQLTHWPARSASAKPVVALHGFTGSGPDFEMLAQASDEEYNWYTPDLLGHGQSDAPKKPESYTIDAYCKQLDGLMVSFGLDRFVLLGYSMGGRLALYYTLMHAKKVSELILIGSSPGLKTEEERVQRFTADEALAREIKKNGMEWFCKYWKDVPAIQSQDKIQDPWKTDMQKRRSQNREHGLINALRGMGTAVQPSLWDRLSECKVPALLVTGSEDKKFEAIMKEMAKKMPAAKHVSIKGAGHSPHLEMPQPFLEAMEKFLSPKAEK